MPRRRNTPLLVLLLLSLTLSLGGCFAPSYVGPKTPYDKREDEIIKTYQLAYDSFVAIQLYPLPIVAATDSRHGDLVFDIVMTIAAPIATLGMLIFGTIASPIVILLPEGWIDWQSLKR